MFDPDTFADLQIRILPLEEPGYPVEITLDGQRQFTRGYLNPSFLPWTAGTSSEEDGQRLFDWLLADATIKSAWDEVKGAHPQRRIRLRIDAEAPELHAIPWEVLRETARESPSLSIAAASSTPFSRYIAGKWDPGTPVRERPIRVAVAIANPDNLDRYRLEQLDVESEWQALQQAMAGLDVELVQLPQPCTLASLEEAVKQGYHIIHFIGHGAKSRDQIETVLFLADEENQVALAHEEDIASMVARHLQDREEASGNDLRLIYLSSCQTATTSSADAFRGVAPGLIRAGVPAVVAMQDLVPIETAQSFSQVFYRQLLQHGIVDLAVNQARSALITTALPGAAIPVLFMRLPDGRLFAVERSQTLRRWALVAGTALVLALVFALAFTFILGPSQMDASARFRVVVAPVGEIDETGEVQQSELTSLIDEWIVAELEAASQPFATGNAIQIWHDLLPITIMRTNLQAIGGETPAIRAEEAAALAERVNAQVVIYGHVRPAGDPTELVVEFYVAPDLARAEADLAIGRYQLGEPIPIGAIDPDSLTSGEALARRVTSRTNALFWLLLILREQLLGKPAETLAIYEEIKPELSNWSERGEGKETLYAFLGDAALASSEFAQAESFYKQSIESNRQFIRAYIGLGSVYFALAQTLQPDERLLEPGYLNSAVENHQTALKLAQSQDRPRLAYVANLALAKDLRVKGETNYALGDYAPAHHDYDNAIVQLEQLIDPLTSAEQYRLLAQVYESLGTAQLQKADMFRRQKDIEASIEHFNLAEQAYDQCISTARLAPDDAYLQDQIAGATCRPMKELAVEHRLKLE